jgi:hypothetical protein
MILTNKFIDDFISELETIIDDNVKYEIVDNNSVNIYLDEEDNEMQSKIEILATKYCFIFDYEVNDDYTLIKLTQQVW